MMESSQLASSAATAKDGSMHTISLEEEILWVCSGGGSNSSPKTFLPLHFWGLS